MSVIFSEPLDYYLERITSQYQLSYDFLSWLGGGTSRAGVQVDGIYQVWIDFTTCLFQFYAAFDIDQAVGAQLDMLGQIIGVGRVVPFTPTGGASSVLDDSHYRLLLRATIGADFWDGTIDGLQQMWHQLFPSGSILTYDNQDMSFTVLLNGAFDQMIKDLIMNDLIVPRPEGVKVNYTFAGLPAFGCDENDAFVAGVDLGHAT